MSLQRRNYTSEQTRTLARLNDRSLESIVRETKRPFVVLFESRYEPNLSKMVDALTSVLERRNGDLRAGICLVEDAPEKSRDLNITGVPTVVGLEQGEIIGRSIGLRSAEELFFLVNTWFPKRRDEYERDPKD